MFNFINNKLKKNKLIVKKLLRYLSLKNKILKEILRTTTQRILFYLTKATLILIQ